MIMQPSIACEQCPHSTKLMSWSNNWSKTSPTNYWSIGDYFVGYSIWFIYGTSCWARCSVEAHSTPLLIRSRGCSPGKCV